MHCYLKFPFCCLHLLHFLLILTGCFLVLLVLQKSLTNVSAQNYLANVAFVYKSNLQNILKNTETSLCSFVTTIDINIKSIFTTNMYHKEKSI